MRVALALGVALFVLSFVDFVISQPTPASSLRKFLATFTRDGRGLYWILQYAIDALGMVALLWKARAAPVTEQRRVSILIGGLIIGFAPTTVWVLLSASVAHFKEYVPLRSAGWLLYPTLLSTPITLAYAVLVHRALNVSLIIRRAIQYALARSSALVLAAIPAAVLIFAIYRKRHQSMSDLVQGSDGLALLVLAGLVVVASAGRRGMLERIDRRFFREQYDARRILNALTETCRRASSRSELAEELRTEINRALHLVSLSVLFLEEDGSFASPRNDVRSLPSDSRLPRTLLSGESVVEVDLERGSGAAASLSTEDRYWLVDAGARVLVPMRGADRAMVGFMVLGEKKSELPYSDEDRLVLSTVGSAAAMSVRSFGAPGATPPRSLAPSIAADAATICVVCGELDDSRATTCSQCGGPMVPAAVPRVLAGKFKLIDRIGEGGMGVVYRALDLTLDRLVAIKALPRLQPDQAVRLRREARAMATIAHPNLALIYGAESWNGLPILIVEFLPGGTLATRLRSGPVSVKDGLSLGVALADVVGALHAAGILHRDVKPSNIGYTADGKPKLLDFGLARLLSRSSGPERQTMEKHVAGVDIPDGQEGATTLRITASVDGQVVGTPLYLSPEALSGLEPLPAFDVWSICIVLFEAITGVNPFEDSTVSATLRRIQTCDATDLSAVMTMADPELTTFFRHAFSRNRAERPATAHDLREQLSSLLVRVAGVGDLPSLAGQHPMARR